jgi:hypothetical protein
MNVQQLEDEIKAKRAVINEANCYISKTQKEIAEYLCPFKVGDSVISLEGNIETIASVSYRSYSPKYEFKVFRTKKNGEPYKESSFPFNQGKYKAADE